MSAWFEHWRGMEGARPLGTPGVKSIGELIEDIVEARGIGLVHGDAGLGKSFGVGMHLHNWAKKTSVCRMEITQRPTETQVLREVLKALTGVEIDMRATTYELWPEVIRELARKPRLLVLDEAQKLIKTGIEILRHLHDDPSTDFALLLVGGNGCWEVISRHPMLVSRVDDRVHLTPWTQEQVATFIPQYHPIYKGISTDELLRIDTEYAHGQMRAWASFTRKAAKRMQREGRPFSRALVTDIYRTVTGQVAEPKAAAQAAPKKATAKGGAAAASKAPKALKGGASPASKAAAKAPNALKSVAKDPKAPKGGARS